MIAFIFQTNNARWSDPVLVQDLEREYRSRLRLIRGKLHKRRHGDPFGPFKPRREAIHVAVTEMSAQEDPGLQTFLANIRGKGVRCRAVRIEDIATTGNYMIDRFFTALSVEFGPGLMNLGAGVCKNVGSTSTKSQHRFWSAIASWRSWGFPTMASSAGANAIDWRFGNPRVLDESFYWAIAHADEFGLENIIHWPQVYRPSPWALIWNPEGGLHRYVIPSGGSDHIGHGHADARPTRTSGDQC